MIINNSNTKTFLLVLTFFIFSCGGDSANNADESAQIDVVDETQDEPLTNSNNETNSSNESKKDKDDQYSKNKANIDEVLKEFPQGALSFLSDNEKQCIAEISTTESLKSMEKSLMEEGAILQEQMDYFTSCNIPGPPGIGIKNTSSSNATESIQETSYFTSFASIESIRSLGEDGVSPHLEKVDDKTLRLFYSSIKVKGIAVSLCDYELNCELQGALERMSDLTIIETIEGVRRGYYVSLNPQTGQKDIYTAIFSEDGLSYTNEISLGFPVDKDEMAWGVPDAVLMPNGLVRVYWVYTEDKTSDEKLISATSRTTKGVDFVIDPGYRLENGYVDFEVIKAEEGDWKALMSYTPHYMPEIPQSLFYATSKDGLKWDLIEERITPEEYTYFDPTGIPIDEKNYLIVGSAAPNVMGSREHLLFTAVLVLP
tara:strand:+ start:2103 stop:3386 length:1284 start_codon:yes stop_codon:yes gene_type:complete